MGESARRLAAEARVVPYATRREETSSNEDDNARHSAFNMETPEYSGEAFHAQFELLAQATGW